MIKKISALILALVLCLSVVVVPASAAGVELGDAKVAFALEWDKASYSAGDTAVLSVYLDVADDIAIESGAITIGLNSAVINTTDNPIADVKANATVCDLFASYFKDPTSNIAWLNTTIAGKVTGANTTEEQALYDHYIKLGMSKNTSSGTHANALLNNDGLYGSEIDSTTPIYTLTFKIASDVADGTAVKAAITTGTLTMPSTAAPSTYIKAYSSPGTATTKANVAATSTNIEQADTTVANGGTDVTIGAASPVKAMSTQIRFNALETTENDVTVRDFDIRSRASISHADFASYIGTEDEAKAASKAGTLYFGFVYYADSTVAFDQTKAQAAIDAKATAGLDGYVYYECSELVKNDSVYFWNCYMTDAAYEDSVSAIGFIVIDGETYFADAVKATDFSTLYDDNYAKYEANVSQA